MSFVGRLESLRELDRFEAQRVLAQRSFWPVDERLVRLALTIRQAPPYPAPGSTLLVSVSDTAERKTLWVLERVAHADGCPFRNRALAAQRIAERLVARDLLLFGPAGDPLASGAWCARPHWVEGVGHDVALDGESIGASFLLASASLALGVPVPPTVAASSSLAPDGTLGAVGRIVEKVAFIDESALGVTTLFVHASQRDHAREGLRSGRVEVVGVTTGSELLRWVFPGLKERSLPEAWQAPEAARGAAERLFALALVPTGSLLAWRQLARAADLLAIQLGSDDSAGRKAAFVREIFRRHAGDPGPLSDLPPADTDALPLPLRLNISAHLVQAAADSWSGIDAAVDKARRVLPARLTDCHAEHLKVRGAIGRALSHARRYDEAGPWLEATVEAWLGLYEPRHASHALSEAIRVRGILRDRGALERLEAIAGQLVSDPDVSLDSLAYLSLGLGRAYVLAGDALRGRHHLDASPLAAEVTRDDVRRCRKRWLANAADAADERESAARLRESLLDTTGEPVDDAMIKLDEVLIRGVDPTLILDEVRERAPHLVATLGSGTQGHELALRLVREYPY